MTAIQTMVVVGAGLAGAKAVETLREEGFDGRVVLFGEEAERPYNRPPLSKEFLTGDKPRDSIYVHEADWYRTHDVELRTGTRVMGLDMSAHVVRTDDGERVPFDKLLLATGSSPRRINLPGSELAGVRYLRRSGDSEALLADIAGGGRHVVLVGGGWIGLEVAAAARGYGNEVDHRRDPADGSAGRARDRDLAEVFAELHREHGVRLLLRDGLAGSIQGANGRVTSVVTTSGQTVPADVVLVGMGARPNVELALQAGTRRGRRGEGRRVAALVPPGRVRGRRHRQRLLLGGRSDGSASSTGRTPSTAAPPRLAPCSASRSSTTASRTSSPTSTTSGWSTPGFLGARRLRPDRLPR